MENPYLVESSMYITKAVKEGKVMKWAAINSDTDPDSYVERMSLELYKDFIDHINNRDDVPEIFRSGVYSNYWKGGMPYLSISHYPDIDGQAVPGEPAEVFVDGNRLKAKGVLYNSPLGHSVFRSLQEDKNKSPDDRIRISIGFLDLAHRHGDGQVWVRDSLTSICPDCLNGVGEKVYVKGYLVHLALTRVPVNKRTEMVLEEKSMAKKTRKEDAASIVGETLAEEIELKAKATALRSDVLIEMSEGETPEVPVVEEPVVEPEVEEPVAAVEEKSEAPVEEKGMSHLPYGGATSMAEAKKAKEAVEEMNQVMDLWGMFSNVAWNIIDSDEVTEKKSAFMKALDEFKGMLATKAMVEFSQTQPVLPSGEMVEKSEKVDHVLKPALDALLSAVDNSVVLEGDINAKLQYIQPTIQELGEAITEFVKTKAVVSEPPAPNKDNDNLLEKITELIRPLSDTVSRVESRIGVLEAKSNATAVETRSRIPQPRSLTPSLIAKTETEKPKPGSLRSIINKSVGITE
jgi:hypothetical protein